MMKQLRKLETSRKTFWLSSLIRLHFDNVFWPRYLHDVFQAVNDSSGNQSVKEVEGPKPR